MAVVVPELVGRRDLADGRAFRAERRERRRDRPQLPLTVALVTDGARADTAPVLRECGADVVGLLGPDALESLAWAGEAGAGRAYADLVALLCDDVEAVVVEVAPPLADVVVRQAARAGLHLLLATPRLSDPEAAREAAELAEAADITHVVAMDTRAWPAALQVRSLVPGLGQLRQLTVLGWPAAAAGVARAELVDLVRGWCGDIVAVCADPAAMPAPQLAPGAPVTLALLTAAGVTVLVAERVGARREAAVLSLTGKQGRVVVQGGAVRRQDGAGRVTTLAEAAPPRTTRIGLADAAYDLLRATEFDDPGLVRGATLRDLLPLARVLQAVETSRTAGGWHEL